jgi:hypothetical protein
MMQRKKVKRDYFLDHDSKKSSEHISSTHKHLKATQKWWIYLTHISCGHSKNHINVSFVCDHCWLSYRVLTL